MFPCLTHILLSIKMKDLASVGATSCITLSPSSALQAKHMVLPVVITPCTLAIYHVIAVLEGEASHALQSEFTQDSITNPVNDHTVRTCVVCKVQLELETFSCTVGTIRGYEATQLTPRGKAMRHTGTIQ